MRAAILAVAILGASGCGKTPLVPSAVHWHDLETGERIAATTGKPVFMFFFAEWSVADMELDREVFPKPAVRAELEHFVPIRVDLSDDEQPGQERIKERFRVLGVPTLLAAAEDGELLRITNFVPEEELVPALRAARLRAEAR